MNAIVKIIKYLAWGFWRLFIVVLGVLLYILLWLFPLFFFDEDGWFASVWIVGFLCLTFYSLAIWHVVSEDERDLPLYKKVTGSLLIAFNKVLFSLIVFIIAVSILGIINGEI